MRELVLIVIVVVVVDNFNAGFLIIVVSHRLPMFQIQPTSSGMALIELIVSQYFRLKRFKRSNHSQNFNSIAVEKFRSKQFMCLPGGYIQ